jgi:hypothetical protein
MVVLAWACICFWIVNIGDQIHYGQQKKQNVGDLIDETLELFEVCFMLFAHHYPYHQSANECSTHCNSQGCTNKRWV